MCTRSCVEINLCKKKLFFGLFYIFQITHIHCEKADIWETGLHASAICVIKDQLVAIRGHRAGDKKMHIKFFNMENGNVINELQSPCDHRVEYIMCQHPADDACVH